MTDVTLECAYCNRETTHDLERVLRGLTLADVQDYFEPMAVKHVCARCGAERPENTMRRSYDRYGWLCGVTPDDLDASACTYRINVQKLREAVEQA